MVIAHLVVMGIRMTRHRLRTPYVLHVMCRLFSTRRLVTSSLCVMRRLRMLCLHGTRCFLLTELIFVSSMLPAAPLMPCLLERAIACLCCSLPDIPDEQPKSACDYEGRDVSAMLLIASSTTSSPSGAEKLPVGTESLS